MALHLAEMTSVLWDAIQQAPVVVQCAQVAPDPWWKWLLPTVVQTVISLLSIGAGVGIAVASFRANRRTEHEQWARDKGLEEWRELISAVASVEDLIPILIDENLKIDALKEAILRVVPNLRNRLFINKDLEEIGFRQAWTELLKFVLSDLRNAENSLAAARIRAANNMADSGLDSAYQEFKEAKIEIRNRYGNLQEKLQQTSRRWLRTQASAQ